MAQLTKDISWTTGLAGALVKAKTERRAIVLKPMGQGVGDNAVW